MSLNRSSETGFTLVEMTVVLLLITLLASVAMRETAELGFQTRYEQTRERLDMIKQAILGNPKQIINGQQAISGFVADMGRLPGSIRELIQRSGDCSDNAGDVSETECLNLATPGAWTATDWNNNSVSKIDPSTSLRYGWNGPYLDISGNAADNDAMTDGWGRVAQGFCSDYTITSSTLCTLPATWTLAVNDHNYGWYFDALSNAPNLTLFSYGKDHVYNGTGYDAEYPEYPVPFNSRPIVNSQDWLLDVSNGISINIVKSTRALPNISFCTDTTILTKAACISPQTWYGGCSKASYYNTTSCTNASGTWTSCSDGISATKPICELAGKNWYGNGFGCSVQSNINANQASCTSNSNTWYSCSDNTKTTLGTCLAASETWYGNNLSSPYFTISNPVNPYTYIPICMKVFYRRQDSTIGILVSDGNINNDATTVQFDPIPIVADGNAQTIKFSGFRDSLSPYDLITTSGLQIPIGNNAIGIYQYDGTSCSTTTILYPTDRQNPIQVDFHPNATLPVINW